jgi:hypothetical protein
MHKLLESWTRGKWAGQGKQKVMRREHNSEILNVTLSRDGITWDGVSI